MRRAEAEQQARCERRLRLEREAADAVRSPICSIGVQPNYTVPTRRVPSGTRMTAETRAAEQRARIELATRGVDPDRAEQGDDRRPMARRAPGRAGCRRPAPATLPTMPSSTDVAAQREADTRAVEPSSTRRCRDKRARRRDLAADEPPRS